MTQVMIYDSSAEILEKMAEANDTTVAELVEMFLEFTEEVKDNNGLD